MKPLAENATVRTLSVRIPVELYPAVHDIALRRKTSVNRLINEELSKLVEEEGDREMYEAASLLSEDIEECDVEYAAVAQSEVVLAYE